ncbi:hypothetical protein BCR44DRAFT_311319 [Catenaria anguillulae PL171]|uniref:Uncharacterized protein n=1 Tax=Catenaria anguillulae PL171 TaxID=765915 RepID=A0A1Y2HUQ6_9FUNG|nr:hypothetical protein BCR44DRAFT_311319 [Catenaria anguillulae PL171]
MDDALEIMHKPPSHHPSHERIISSRTYALRRCTVEPPASSPWTSVATLDFGPPPFTSVNHGESLDMLALLARAFPYLNRLVIRANDSCVADILLAVDPFVRRRPEIGPPLREPGVMRLKTGLGCSSRSYVPSAAVKKICEPTCGHLHPLFISVHVTTLHELGADLNKILIHPSLALGLERINTMGVRLNVSAASCAGTHECLVSTIQAPRSCHSTAPSRFPSSKLRCPIYAASTSDSSRA